MANYTVARFGELAPVDCPCGETRRAFLDAGSPASVHLLEVKREARRHFHRRLTEVYYVLAGEGHLEVDADRVPLAPGTAVMIRPGCRHRAVGRLTLLVLVTPPFDPADEFEA
jgi:mannose-6-phosphate isomerase-like protein (cupin superfamily)